MPSKVWVVVEGPDMSYYGDAEIHGVYSGKDAAEAKAHEADPRWYGSELSNVRVEEWDVDA